MINIDEWSVIMYRVSTRILDDDGITIIGERYFRPPPLEPGSDVTSQPVKIRAIANLIWTQAVIDAWNTHKIAIKPPFPG